MDFSLFLQGFMLAHFPTQHERQFVNSKCCILIISLNNTPFQLISLSLFTMPSSSLPISALKSPSMGTYVLLSIQFFIYVEI